MKVVICVVVVEGKRDIFYYFMFLFVFDNLKSMVVLGDDLFVMNVDNGLIDVVVFVKVSDVVFVVIRFGDGVVFVNDKEVLEVGKCIELDMIDVLLFLL